MKKFTQKSLKALAENGAEDITSANNKDRLEILKLEGSLSQIGYSAGTYGCNGMLFVGRATKKFYVITARTNAIFIFG